MEYQAMKISNPLALSLALAVFVLGVAPISGHAESVRSTSSRPNSSHKGISGTASTLPCVLLPPSTFCDNRFAIAHARVTIIDQSNNRQFVARTDEAGLFKKRLPSGLYSVSVAGPVGYQCYWKGDITVGKGYSNVNIECEGTDVLRSPQ